MPDNRVPWKCVNYKTNYSCLYYYKYFDGRNMSLDFMAISILNMYQPNIYAFNTNGCICVCVIMKIDGNKKKKTFAKYKYQNYKTKIVKKRKKKNESLNACYNLPQT